ncbi:RHS repeat-associated core domain-containing protein [Roseofilum sp. Belize Diploria]|uniref:RHS repeat domain-containing protein n=2 Tax=unclassified Roseofilum TaxID=2620099 RepID=UPI001B2CF4FE|nr:RHS repeat-associated core domain-containing protein [Roseofilum sp. Belize Diploria]MBP0011370.1 RHS repeat-associated core domain-containing protein [Roseofilum sp. Belize Diploria]
MGNIASHTDFNSETNQYEYDKDNQLIVKDLEDDINVEYSYTEDGQIASITDSRGTTEYDYDELYRLIEAAVWGGETITYRYDEVGNRISAGALRYIYDDNDRLIEEREGGEIVVEYGYDDNGNLLSRTEGNETVNYVWDDRNRLVEVEKNGERVEFEYDDDNIRVSQTVGGEKTSFLLDKNRPYDQVLAEYTNGSLDASYVYGLDLISQERNEIDSFYVVDGLGSTRGLTDSSGGVTDAYWYDAYGNLVEHEGSSENNYLFAGEQFDEALGQYYLRQRYYDASTGRFTRRDTWEGDRSNPITLNKYLYANGNPVSYIDPSGLYATTLGAYFAIKAVLLAIAVIGIGVAAYYNTTYEPERLRGFGEGPGLDIRDIESPRPRDPKESLLGRILTFPREQLRVPDHTGHPRDNSLDNLIRHVFHSDVGPDYANDPLSIWGKSADDIKQEYEDDGYKADIEQGKRGSGKSKQIRIEKHPEVTNIQVHPGGGRHITPYYKISTSTKGKIWVVPKGFKKEPNMKGQIIEIP